ncbi:tRNA (cytidine(34)-2'-O)-methyltransferase [Azospirillum picis]|uniref:tRNA (cytidine(34)-2'-O)-methyltransferase n=1 Tax=Azospirillum picis TaxID=488438 RepID=A0ABU0MI90_9PROT|nr:tRNA (cytidine(34)-2'-O)-methyltransferase [Azospirillum picis]MBP2299334.1 tRNA (cytidine/uridine-2'-O-)-methyltransferase [Azospirillum picis]MDQ0533028.1 tRNA (cytidine/uridine-2'-O-)-methyltransferase [Azospirillum picis]
MRIILFEPDIPQNTGTLMRLAAALGVALDLIEPCGFVLDDRRLRRAGMDYLDHLDWTRHSSWSSYVAAPRPGRLVLLTTRAAVPYTSFRFAANDRILVGRESAGVPDEVHDAADARLVIPMQPHARSLNVAVSAAMVLGEALRQTAAPGFQAPAPPDTNTP